jgi:tRNA dimethylallyltransferase
MSMPLCLAGPTASGKTAAALAIAQRWPVEIISVDSALVYRGMDIGTAKASAAERAVVPHHLIDIRDPLQAYSAAEFVRDARTLIAEIRQRDRGRCWWAAPCCTSRRCSTAWTTMPAADPEVRALDRPGPRQRGWPALHAELAAVDPVTSARLAPNDSQRIQRALEVWTLTGRPLSAFHGQPQVGAFQIAINPIAQHADFTRAGALISLGTENRAWLHERIAQRFDAMLAAGLVDEVQALRQRGDLHADLPSMRCVGYRQAWEVLDGTAPMAGAARARHCRHAPAGQAPDHLAAQHAAAPGGACDAPDALAQVLAAQWRPAP